MNSAAPSQNLSLLFWRLDQVELGHQRNRQCFQPMKEPVKLGRPFTGTTLATGRERPFAWLCWAVARTRNWLDEGIQIRAEKFGQKRGPPVYESPRLRITSTLLANWGVSESRKLNY